MAGFPIGVIGCVLQQHITYMLSIFGIKECSVATFSTRGRAGSLHTQLQRVGGFSGAGGTYTRAQIPL